MGERQFHVVVLRKFFFFIKSDTHYKNPWSHAKLRFSLARTNVTLRSNYQLNHLPWQAEILAQGSNLTPQRANRILWFACGTEVASLRSRRLEVVGERKNGRARERHARGEGGPLSPRVSPSRTGPFFLASTAFWSSCYSGYIFSRPRTLPPSVSIQYLLQAWYWR